ncbi:MAG: penicillin-binding transpeptidase domain-containing protein [Acutalibacteraceae bacterium]
MTSSFLSFYGFAPADDPEIAVLVMLDEPQKNNQYGSVIAAPVVGNILADILPYLGFEPSYTEEQLSSADMATPYLINYGLQEAQTTLVQAGLQYRVVGNGTKVVGQTPGAAMPIPGRRHRGALHRIGGGADGIGALCHRQDGL